MKYEGSDFARIAHRLDRLFRTHGEIYDARRQPELREAAARGVRLSHERSNSWGSVSAETEAIVKRAAEYFGRFVAAERAAGESEKREKLLAIAAELEQTRAVLPQIAAALAIDLGVAARELREEAGAAP